MAGKGNKEEVYFKICNTVLRLEVSKGHQKWTLSDIAKYADVTRSLIYYYFGKEKKTIVEEAFRYMLDLFFNLNSDEHRGVAARMSNIIPKIKEMPYCFVLFFLERSKETEIGVIIRQKEKALLERLKSEYPDMDANQILRVYLMELGAIAFSLDNEKVFEIFPPMQSK
ncbi:MAG: TetR/AcrR family transcriptional regulator [Halobacteriovoraceae bacterium]|jgi:AcrR family transcriptional regulator|nr:TetR/AcrR family transcriptional regulator [Halobacteriovoraceae bacterium]MBT5095340.1 TetR/AcrR family transcriptional regulator [Halobacteriovoraceae bacterium]